MTHRSGSSRRSAFPYAVTGAAFNRRASGTFIMKKQISALSFLILAVVMIMTPLSCTNYHSPIIVPVLMPRLDSPEMSIRSKSIVIGTSAAYPTKLMLVRDISVDPVITNDPAISYEKDPPTLSVNFGLSLMNRFEISGDIVNGIQIKSQLLGERRQDAQLGNRSIAVVFGTNYSHGSDDRMISSYSSYGSRSAYYDWKLNSYSTGIILGYRPHKAIVIYGGPNVTAFTLSGTLNQVGMGPLYEDSYEYILDSKGLSRGVGLGVEFLFDAEIAQQAIIYTLNVSQLAWEGYRSDTLFGHSLQIRYYF